jgi:hypothetical protein
VQPSTGPCKERKSGEPWAPCGPVPGFAARQSRQRIRDSRRRRAKENSEHGPDQVSCLPQPAALVNNSNLDYYSGVFWCCLFPRSRPAPRSEVDTHAHNTGFPCPPLLHQEPAPSPLLFFTYPSLSPLLTHSPSLTHHYHSHSLPSLSIALFALPRVCCLFSRARTVTSQAQHPVCAAAPSPTPQHHDQRLLTTPTPRHFPSLHSLTRLPALLAFGARCAPRLSFVPEHCTTNPQRRHLCHPLPGDRHIPPPRTPCIISRILPSPLRFNSPLASHDGTQLSSVNTRHQTGLSIYRSDIAQCPRRSPSVAHSIPE